MANVYLSEKRPLVLQPHYYDVVYTNRFGVSLTLLRRQFAEDCCIECGRELTNKPEWRTYELLACTRCPRSMCITCGTTHHCVGWKKGDGTAVHFGWEDILKFTHLSRPMNKDLNEKLLLGYAPIDRGQQFWYPWAPYLDPKEDGPYLWDPVMRRMRDEAHKLFAVQAFRGEGRLPFFCIIDEIDGTETG